MTSRRPSRRPLSGLRGLALGTTMLGCPLIQILSAAESVAAVSVRDPGLRASASAGGYSALPSLSRDGRFVAFVSSAQNLVPGDVNGAALDVFVRDRATRTTRLVSVSADGQTSADDVSFAPSISAEGRWIAFESKVLNLVAQPVSGTGDVYVRDLEVGTTRLVSVNRPGTGGGLAASGEPEITPDGRFVVFVSAAPNLVANDTNQATDVFVRNLETGRTTLVSVNSQGTGSAAVAGEGSRGSGNAVISEGGRFVAFESDATNLAPGDFDGHTHVYVRDLELGTTRLASANTNGVPPPSGGSSRPLLSADGRYVVFISTAADLAPGSLEGVMAIYRRDLEAGMTMQVSPAPGPDTGEAAEPALSRDGRWVAFGCWNVRESRSEVRLWDAQTGSSTVVSLNTAGEAALGWSGSPQLSADGAVLAFLSAAPNLVTAPTHGQLQVYVRDLATGMTLLTSRAAGAEAGGSRTDCLEPVLSADGGVVAFIAADGGLVPDDDNGELDVFAYESGVPVVELMSAADPALAPLTGTGPSSLAGGGVSADGRFVLYTSLAADLVPLDTNGTYDVFLRDLVTGTNLLISANPQTGLPAAGSAHDPVMTPDARHVLFFSSAPDWFAPDTNRVEELFLRDLASGATELVSLSLDGTTAGGVDNLSPVLSARGRYVAFSSRTLDLPRYTRYTTYLRDRVAQTTVKVATTSALVPSSVVPRPLAFVGETSLLFLEGTNVFRHDVAAGVNERLPLDLPTSRTSLDVVLAIAPHDRYAAFQVPQLAAGGPYRQRLSRYHFTSRTMLSVVETAETGPFSTAGWKVAISADGRFIAFVSSAGLTFQDGNETSDVYLADLDYPGLVTLVSVNATGTAAGNGASDAPGLSADGRFVSFRSTATDLVPHADANGVPDVFVRDLWAGVTYLASVNVEGSGTGDHRSAEPWLSADGTRVAFTSFASDLVPGDFNQIGDVFTFSVPQDGLADAYQPWGRI